MNRREFLQAGTSIALATGLGGLPVLADRRQGSPAGQGSESSAELAAGPLAVRFLGTGGADWRGKDERGEMRRFCSTQFDGKILIDFSSQTEDMLPPGYHPTAIFYTHSHRDHYDPAAAVRLSPSAVYVGKTWFRRAVQDFSRASRESHLPIPEIIPIGVGESVQVEGIRFTALPANHSTSDPGEQTLIYLLEKKGVRVLYATDTGGIMTAAARLAGIDAHVKGGTPITGLIMEATMGLDYDEDYRMFSHSSVHDVLRTTHMLLKTSRYTPPEGQPVYLTHLARTLHGTQAELDRNLPTPLRAAYDGLEVLFR